MISQRTAEMDLLRTIRSATHRELRSLEYGVSRERHVRHYVPCGNLTRKQAISDRTWDRMVELDLVDAE